MISGGLTKGFSSSGKKSATILNTATVANAVIDLGKNYAFIVVAIPDCTGFVTSAELRMKAGLESAAALYDVYEPNDPATGWSKAVPLTGAIMFRAIGPDFARFIEFSVSVATDGDVVINVWGFDGVS
jgi:hypothetical protein